MPPVAWVEYSRRHQGLAGARPDGQTLDAAG